MLTNRSFGHFEPEEIRDDGGVNEKKTDKIMRANPKVAGLELSSDV